MKTWHSKRKKPQELWNCQSLRCKFLCVVHNTIRKSYSATFAIKLFRFELLLLQSDVLFWQLLTWNWNQWDDAIELTMAPYPGLSWTILKRTKNLNLNFLLIWELFWVHIKMTIFDLCKVKKCCRKHVVADFGKHNSLTVSHCFIERPSYAIAM